MTCVLFCVLAGYRVKFNPDIHHRQSIRLRGYNYSTVGFYFVTICLQGRESLLGEIADGVMVLNAAGRMVKNVWAELPVRYPGITVDEHVIMPNHFHGIIVLQSPDVGAGPRACPDFTGSRREGHPQGGAPTAGGLSLPDVVHRFKSLTTARYRHGVDNEGWPPFPGKFWQRNYYERIIRNEDELHKIRQYIRDNPIKWDIDDENPIHNP